MRECSRIFLLYKDLDILSFFWYSIYYYEIGKRYNSMPQRREVFADSSQILRGNR